MLDNVSSGFSNSKSPNKTKKKEPKEIMKKRRERAICVVRGIPTIYSTLNS